MAICYYDYSNHNENKFIQYSTTLTAAYLMTRVGFYYFMIPIILSLFSGRTINNIRIQRRRGVQVGQANLHCRSEAQLTCMLITQVATYFLFFVPSAITHILLYFVPPLSTPYFTIIRTFTVIWQQGSYFPYKNISRKI